LADFLTIIEKKGTLKNIKLLYIGDTKNNMGNSLMIGAAKMGMHFVACAPKELWPDEKLRHICQEIATHSGAKLEFIED
jgi:ornithine carbamoyltransferase